MCSRPKAPKPPPPPPAPPKAAAAGPQDIQTFEFETNLSTQNKKKAWQETDSNQTRESVNMAGSANFGGTGSSTNTGGLSIPKSAA